MPSERKYSPAVDALMDAPYGHHVRRDADGNSVVTLILPRGKSVTRIASSFDAAVFAALAAAEQGGG